MLFSPESYNYLLFPGDYYTAKFLFNRQERKYWSHLKWIGMNRKNISSALLVAVLVGSLLNLINNYDIFTEGSFSNKNTIKIMLTYITPFCVSLYSSVKASRRKA